MWYAYTIVGVFLFILLFMPKKLTLREMYFSAGVLGFGAWLGNALVGDVFKAFRIGPSPHTYFIDYVFISFVPLAIGLVYLNFLTYKKSTLYNWLWVVLSFLLELGAVKSGYMVSMGWKTWYSIPVFMFLFLFFLPWHLTIMRSE